MSAQVPDGELRHAASTLAAATTADPGYARLTDLLVARGGRTVLHHRPGPPGPHDLFSVTKTVVALLTGIAVADGLLEQDVEVAHVLPELGTGPAVGGRTVAHLLEMQRGAKTDGAYDLDEVAVSAGSWAARFAEAPEVESPGTRFRYDNGASQLLAEVLERATGDLAAYAGERLFTPLGISDWTWLRDPTGTPSGAAHLFLTAADLARVGTLLCDDGHWRGVPLVPATWLRAMRTPTSGGGPPEDRRYGRGLWIEDDEVFFGAGWAGQLLLCRPEDGLVVVTQSDPGFDYGPPARDAMPPGWRAPLELVRRHLL